MPEIPDLENFARNLHQHLAGKKLKAVTVVNGKKLKDTEAELNKRLKKATLQQVYRTGKEIRFKFSNDTLVGMHLMLHGDLYLFEKKNEHKFTIVELLFDDGKGLAITDWQKNANIKLDPVDKKGLDALDPKMNTAYLKQVMQTSSAMIKNLLTDQDIIRGLGNAYTDEILWTARISPFSIAKAVPADKISPLSKAIKQVLKHAINHIQKANPENVTGEIRDFLVVHNSQRKESPNGFEIKKEKKGGSNTYYTEEQELYT